MTFKYSKSGRELWMAKYRAGAGGTPVAIKIDGGGDIYITGSETPDENGKYEIATVKYRQMHRP